MSRCPLGHLTTHARRRRKRRWERLSQRSPQMEACKGWLVGEHEAGGRSPPPHIVEAATQRSTPQLRVPSSPRKPGCRWSPMTSLLLNELFSRTSGTGGNKKALLHSFTVPDWSHLEQGSKALKNRPLLDVQILTVIGTCAYFHTARMSMSFCFSHDIM